MKHTEVLKILAVILLVLASDAMAGEVEIIAHRGASYDAPENTLAAVRRAWDVDADAVEIDVQLSKDSHIVVFHDETTKRLAGVDRPVASQTLEELRRLDVGSWKGEQFRGERIPTLAEVLATIPQGKRVFVELKAGPEIVAKLKEAIAVSKKASDQVAIISFSQEAVVLARKQLPDHQVYRVTKAKRKKLLSRRYPSLSRLTKECVDARIDGLDVDAASHLERKQVDQLHQAGLKLYVWTVNSPEDARTLRESGIDGITTDRPDLLRRALGE